MLGKLGLVHLGAVGLIAQSGSLGIRFGHHRTLGQDLPTQKRTAAQAEMDDEFTALCHGKFQRC